MQAAGRISLCLHDATCLCSLGENVQGERS